MPVGAAILSEFQDDENKMWGEVRLSDLKVKPGFQTKLIHILQVEKFPLFVAKSDVAEEINPGVMELGCYSACTIPENNYFATYEGTRLLNYDPNSAITESDKQFYLISYVDPSNGLPVVINGYDAVNGRGCCYMSYANDGLSRRAANCTMIYDPDTDKCKFYALKTIYPCEEILWIYDHTGIWWFERGHVLPEVLYQEVLRKYPTLVRNVLTSESGIEIRTGSLNTMKAVINVDSNATATNTNITCASFESTPSTDDMVISNANNNYNPLRLLTNCSFH